MKKILLAAFIASFTMSCGNEKSADSATQSMSEQAQESVTVSAEDIKAGKVDPVCEMTYDAGWVENTVYMNDTIRFCSENCKTAFVARPEKYLKTAN